MGIKMSRLSENIRNLRLLHGLSQRQLANEIERVPSTISNWERGSISPDGDSIEKLCVYFKITPNQLLGWEKCPELDRYIADMDVAIKEMEELQKKKSELETRIRAYQKLLSRT